MPTIIIKCPHCQNPHTHSYSFVNVGFRVDEETKENATIWFDCDFCNQRSELKVQPVTISKMKHISTFCCTLCEDSEGGNHIGFPLEDDWSAYFGIILCKEHEKRILKNIPKDTSNVEKGKWLRKKMISINKNYKNCTRNAVANSREWKDSDE